MRNPRSRVVRTRRGDYQIRLPPAERALLRDLPAQLREMLSTDDPALERLFPPAHPDDEELDAEYRSMVREDLVAGKVSSLQVMEETIDADRLSEEQLLAWLGAINDLRLVLGTRLEVTEELYEEGVSPDDPRAPAFAVFQYLGWLEEHVVEALASGQGAGPAEG